MRKLILSIFMVSLLVSSLTGQHERMPESFRSLEMKSFGEYIVKSQDNIPDTSIDVTFYYLDLSIAIDSQYISGKVICNFEPLIPGLNSIWLSLNSSLTVDDVTGDVNSYLQTGDSIQIILDASYNPGDELEVEIIYHGVPVMAGGYKGLRYETHHSGEPIIATLSTPYLAHYWYPCKDGPSDKPDSVYVDITIPVKFVNGKEVIAVSNGMLENVIDNGTEKTYQWRHRYPVVTYYVMAAISNFVMFEENYTGIYGEEYPLQYYVFQQDLSASQNGVVDMPLALDVFSEKFGVYPFSEEKYGMTQLGFYGAIENQTNTITNNMFESWFMVSVHELGHMWFGDMITCGNWHHGWLNEGFASYSEAVYIEAVDGFDAYQDYMEDFEYYNGGTLYLQNANDTFNIFQGIIYNKGAYTLHMLRGVLGDSIFWDCIYDYSIDPDFMYGQAVTEDFQQVCEDVSGDDLDYFFDQWIYDERYPIYYFNFENYSDSVAFLIWQVQEQSGWRSLFEMPLEVRLYYSGGGDTTIRIWNDEIYQVVTLAVDDEISMMEIDPNEWVLDKSYYHPEIPVGLDEAHIDENIARIYPNPVSNAANLEVYTNEKDLDFILNDINGKVIMQIQGLQSGRYEINRNDFPAGVYFYRIQSSSSHILQAGKLIFN